MNYTDKQWAMRALAFARKIAPLAKSYPKEFDKPEYAECKLDLIDRWETMNFGCTAYHTRTIKMLMEVLSDRYDGPHSAHLHCFFIKIRLSFTVREIK